MVRRPTPCFGNQGEPSFLPTSASPQFRHTGPTRACACLRCLRSQLINRPRHSTPNPPQACYTAQEQADAPTCVMRLGRAWGGGSTACQLHEPLAATGRLKAPRITHCVRAYLGHAMQRCSRQLCATLCRICASTCALPPCWTRAPPCLQPGKHPFKEVLKPTRNKIVVVHLGTCRRRLRVRVRV